METINKNVARKVLKVVDAGLTSGLGKPEPGKMCVEAAVCYALGLPHSDKPQCVGEAVRRFKIRLNDARWPSNEARTKGMRKLAIAQLGSNEINQREFANIVVLETIRQIIPETFRFAIKHSKKLTAEQKKRFKVCAKECAAAKDITQARMAAQHAKSAAYDAAAAAAAAYATYVAYDAYDAAYAATAAAYATYVAAYDAAYATAAAYKKFGLKILLICAQIGLEALITLKSPGVEWLDICK